MSAKVELRAEDVDRRWTLGSSAERIGASLEAPASALALFLWQRVVLDDPQVRFSGPQRMMDELSAVRLTP